MRQNGYLPLRQIGLIMWKNILIRKNQKLTTTMQFLVPLLFGLIVVLLSILFEEDALCFLKQDDFPLSGRQTEPLITQDEMIEATAANLFGGFETDFVVAFAPNDAMARNVMELVKGAFSSKNNTKMALLGFSSEELLESEFSKTLLSDSNWTVGIIFEDGMSLARVEFPVGHTFTYKIRIPQVTELPGEDGLLTPIRQRIFNPHDFLASDMETGIPMPNVTLMGVAGLQILLDKALIQVLSGTTGPIVNYSINTQAFPYFVHPNSSGQEPSHSQFIKFYYLFAKDIVIIGVIFIVPAVMSPLVAEKETGIKELMKMMGLPNWMHWLGWLLNSMMVQILSMSALVILFIIPFSASGAVLRYDAPSVLWALLIMYTLAATTFCFFISVFFSRPVLASAVGVVVWLLSYYGLAVPLDIAYPDVTWSQKMGTALLPNMAFNWAIKAMSLKQPCVGAQWSNIYEDVSEADRLSVADMFHMLTVDFMLFFILAVYLESVLPSDFGVRKPWYYIFMPEKWTCLFKSIQPNEQLLVGSNEPRPGFEEEQSNLVPGIVFEKLTKKFGPNKVAVHELSFKMYTGQITALLGHNGAGKTTTISILTGIFAPTTGTAFVNGYNITTQMDNVRHDLGLCPQHNMLFEDLTIENHLIFFGKLKGMTTEENKAEITSLLEALNLKDKRHALAKSLSGGQKRKLSLMIAIIGGTKVVILDEPTSGMDPEARRGIWDLLLELRGQRTIILTTHFMEEADCLGDRIAIMAGGNIKCCGTSIFLKKFYGTGYNLKMTVSPTVDKDLILEMIQRHVPEAIWKTQNFEHMSDLVISLPNESNAISNFSPMFAEIQENKEALGIVTIGLSLTSMDDVFSKVDELNREQIEQTMPRRQSFRRFSLPIRRTIVAGFSRYVQQLWAIILKRFIYTLRKKKLLFSQFIIPILILSASVLIVNDEFPEAFAPSIKVNVSLAPFKNMIALYASKPGNEELEKNFISLIDPRQTNKVSNIEQKLSMTETQNLRTYIVGADFGDNFSTTAYFSATSPTSAPIAINLVTNAILKNIYPGKNYSIQMSFQPLDSILNRAKPILVFLESARSFQSIYPIFGIFVPASLAILAAGFMVYPVEERLSKVKQLQLMTGMSPLTYWGSAFLWDFMIFTLASLLLMSCFPIFEFFAIYTIFGGLGVVFFILLIYGFAAIPFSYVSTLHVKTVPSGFALVTLVHILTGTILPMATLFLLYFPETEDYSSIVRHLGRPFPTFGVSMSLMLFTAASVENSRCGLFPEDVKSIICNQTEQFPLQRLCCENCNVTGKCFEPHHLLSWTHQHRGNPIPDLGQELPVMITMGCVYIALLLMIEHGVLEKVKKLIFKSPQPTFELYSKDDDVLAEIQRVKDLVRNDDVRSDELVVDGLCKGYGSFAAVSNLSFGVHIGECFGLLGVNGAGKTTTFRMLTGDETLSRGNAYMLDYSLDKGQKEFFAGVGYCPQFDAIIGVLSGRQMLALFGRLRGVPSPLISRETDKWMHKLGLFEVGNVECHKYSGGMKRRLSAGMAMIGDPEIILLDEPTSGVDPVARRQFWQVVAGIRDSGRSIILTSHSMDECEALCTRLGIMVNGQFQCFGGVQHLKNKFAQGFSLIIKLKSNMHASSEEVKPLTFKINQLFEPCILKDKHQNILHYQLLNTTMQWNVLFELMENLKQEYEEMIEDFSVNETTLEDVFLSFAKQQHTHRKTTTSGHCKFLNCKC